MRHGAESRGLTGLRGIAALLVMLHHAMLHGGVEIAVMPVQRLLHRGYLGVDLFFVLSGFVMAMTYGDWFDGTRRASLPRYVLFLARRVARLWPLHAAVLLLFLADGLLDPAFPYSARRVAANLVMVQAWGLSSAINAPAWSISTEMFAYAVFPLLVPVVLLGRVRPAVSAASVAATLAFCMHAGPPLGPARRGLLDIYFNGSFLPLLRCLAGFTAGMLAWRALRLEGVRRIAAWPWVALALLAAVPAAMMAGAGDAFIFAAFPALVLAVHVGRGPAYRALGHGPLHRLGVLSYAIYLLHVFVLDHVDLWPGESWEELVALGLVTLAAATVAHAAVEVPGRRAIRGLAEAVLDRRLLHGPAR